MQRWTSDPLGVVRDPSAPFVRADLELIGVDQRVPSFVAYVYLDNKDVAEDAGTEGKGYAGSFALFGHGEECWGDEGHCDVLEPVSPFDRRAESSFQAANLTVDVTEALKAIHSGEVRVTILAWPADPDDETAEPLRFDELMLVTYDQ
jgi:hypothetical protein